MPTTSIVFSNGEQYWQGFGQRHVIDRLCLLMSRVDSLENLVDALSIPDAEAQVLSLERLAVKAVSRPWFEKILRDYDDLFDRRTKEIAAKLARQID